MSSTIERRFDLSGGIQSASSWLLRKANEIDDAYNVRFNKYLGAITRRDGYVTEGNSLISTNRAQGIHEAKFSTGAITFLAQNNAANNATILEYYNKASSANWTSFTMPNAIDVDTVVSMNDSLGEMYICGKSPTTGNRMQIVNVQNTLATSTTRNLYGAPKARHIVEYQGALYAINVDINGVIYNDRAYRSSNALGAITFIQGYQAFGTTNITVKVDSVQYLKPGMVLDLYKAGTETKTYDSLTIISVDKNLKTITFAAQSTSSTNASANATTDQLLVTSTALFPTGTPVMLTGGTPPTGISLNTTYFAINIDSTHMQLAASYSNAVAPVPIPVDITAVGSGTSTVWQGVADNDELWGHSRKNQLSYYWNLDYPTTDQADFLRIIPGIASDPEITSYAKSNNRLFLFTKTAMFKWDNANLVPVFEDVGCVNQDTIVNIDDWLIWVDVDGQIHARNDSTGQHEIISRGIRNKWLENVTNAQFVAASAGRAKQVYKICVGSVTVNGITQIWRFCYDFDSNNWTREVHTRPMTGHLRSDMSGNMRMYFVDNTGQMFLDEQGTTDNGTTIPMYVRLGKSNDGTEEAKIYQGFYVYGVATAGMSIKLYVDDRDPIDLGQLEGLCSRIPIPAKVKASGRVYDIEFTSNVEGQAPAIEGIAMYYDMEEDSFG